MSASAPLPNSSVRRWLPDVFYGVAPAPIVAAKVLPRSAAHFWIALRYQAKFYLRSTRFYVFFGILAAVGTIIAAIVAFRGAPETASANFLAGGFGLMAALFVPMLAVVFGGDSASTDLGTAAGYYTLPLPVRRQTLLLGRITAAFLLAFACLLVFIVGISAIAWAEFRQLPVLELLAATGLTALALGAALVVSVFFSALFRHNAFGFLLSFIFLFVVFNIAAQLLALYGDLPQWWSLPNATTVLLRPYASPVGQSFSDYSQDVGVLFGYLAGFALAALLIFRRQEMRP